MAAVASTVAIILVGLSNTKYSYGPTGRADKVIAKY